MCAVLILQLAEQFIELLLVLILAKKSIGILCSLDSCLPIVIYMLGNISWYGRILAE